MEFIIMAVLTTTLAVFSWWAGYKLGERKGWNEGQTNMERVYRSYFNYRPTGDTTCKEKSNTQ